MKVETAIEHIKVWLTRPQVSQIIINKKPGWTEEDTDDLIRLEIKQQYIHDEELKIPQSNR